MQAIVFKLQKLRRHNVTFRSYPRRLIDENRWRASRYGLDGKLIDFGRWANEEYRVPDQRINPPEVTERPGADERDEDDRS